MKKLLFFFGFAITALLALVIFADPAAATHVDPIFIAGNPSCTGLGYDFGFKPQPEPPPSGMYTYPDAINDVTITSDGTYFDWVSTLGVDAVIVKGGPNANLYVYDPPTESLGDMGLHSPINPNNNQPFDISHIEFCYDYEVDVNKDAHTTFTRTFAWTIDKSVTPETWDLFTGDSGISKYTVAVTKDAGIDSDWAVSGTIWIDNNTPFDATIEGVADVVSPAINASVNCGVTFPHELASGDSLPCTYSTPLPDGSDRTNTATVTTSGVVGGGEATANVTFGAPTTVVNDSINVDDTNGGSWMFSDSGSKMYDRTFTCDGDAGTHGNTATIRETGQSADASVTVTCRELTVTKNAQTTFDRNWTWTIDKEGDQTDLTLSEGQQFLVNYSVRVNATSTDDNFAVSGKIQISNPHPTRAAELTAVTDLISPNIAAIVNCPALSVPAGGMLECSYSASLPDASSRTNTATATLQNYSFASDGTPTAAGTTDFSGTADVAFGSAPTNEYDECITVTDDKYGNLGVVCANEAPKEINYSMNVGPYDVCGTYQFINTASFETNDNPNTGNDSWTVNVNVPCADGCTLTQGYWRTHSEHGPAPYDDTWALLPNGADTPFFLSGQTYYEVLWTPPAGNPYYILARQYIAAQLNFLNGADPTDAQDAFDEATGLFNAYTPAQVDGLKGKDKKMWTDLATTLDNYNNGILGPGHCSE